MINSRRGPSGSGRSRLGGILCGLGLIALVACTGCQSDIAGQTLPSPYYLSDDIQYYTPGPEFKLAKEGAALKAARQELELRQGPPRPGQGQ
jgi:hypothetical protein